MSHISIYGTRCFVWGNKVTKTPRGDGTKFDMCKSLVLVPADAMWNSKRFWQAGSQIRCSLAGGEPEAGSVRFSYGCIWSTCAHCEPTRFFLFPTTILTESAYFLQEHHQHTHRPLQASASHPLSGSAYRAKRYSDVGCWTRSLSLRRRPPPIFRDRKCSPRARVERAGAT